MKECRCCKIEKLEDHFTKRSSNSDGLYSYCKECNRKKNKERYEKNSSVYLEKNRKYKRKNKEYLREKSKIYYEKNRKTCLEKTKLFREKNKPKISLKEAFKRLSDKDRFEKNRKSHLEWSKDNREKLNKYQRDWYQKNKEKRRAHVILNRAVNSGKVMRPKSCSECNKNCKPDGHHEDYSKPLDVVWICRACHSRKSPRTILR